MCKNLWNKNKRVLFPQGSAVGLAVSFCLIQQALCIHICQTTDTEGQLHNAILYKGLEHPRVLVSMELLEPMPCRWEGWLYMFLSWASMIKNGVFWPMMGCPEFRYVVECGWSDGNFYLATSPLMLPDYYQRLSWGKVLWEQNKENVGKKHSRWCHLISFKDNFMARCHIFSIYLALNFRVRCCHHRAIISLFILIERWSIWQKGLTLPIHLNELKVHHKGLPWWHSG